VTIRSAAIAALLATSALAVPALATDGPPGHSHGPAMHGGQAHGATHTDGRPGRPEDVKRTVRIEASDNAFNLKQIQVRAGETIRFVVTNAGQSTHEFAIADPKEHEEHRAMMRQMPGMMHDEPNVLTVEPGETKELLWRFGKDANVEFACNIRGHAEDGMTGAFRVMR
jgi:uncharacterized cupredoxin-like copper-binding protein